MNVPQTIITVGSVAVACALVWLLSHSLLAAALRSRRRELSALRRRLRERDAHIEALERSRSQLASYLVDSLTLDLPTGLPNRTKLLEQLRRDFAGAGRGAGRRACMVVVRLWQLEQLSHSLGARVAHHVAREAAARLRRAAGRNAQVARIGDRDLALCLPWSAQEDFAPLAARLLEALEDRFRIGGESVYLHAALGLAEGRHASGDVGALIDKACLAADEAVAAGEKWFMFRAEAQEERLSLLHLEADLRGALDKNELRLNFQPIMDVRKGSIAGFEALLRWRHPGGATVAPERFIPLAERIGLMPRISEWVFREGVAKLKQWLDVRSAPLYLSMNLTPRDLNPEFCAEVLRLIDSVGIPPSCIGVEVTESAVVRDFKFAARLIGELNERGIRVLLDDFGTGYSSLSYLRELPFQCVKIDRSFLSRMTEEARDFGLMRSIVSLVHYLEMECVAEGIETREQLDLLTAIDCNYWQGNLFSAPVESADVEPLLRLRAPVTTGGLARL